MAAETSAIRIVDVRALAPEARAALLKRFDAELFRPAFPDDDIREDPQVWLDLMAADPGPPMPQVAPLIALDAEEAIVGGVVIEYYRGSKAALLTYIVTAPKARGKGLARRLAEAAVEAVRALNGGTIPIVFAEAERPEDMATPELVLKARARLKILARLGAVRANIDYTQPPLAPGLSSRKLHLLAAKETLSDRASAPAAQVRDFLEELYLALGHDPRADAAFKAMTARLEREPTVRFLPLSLGASSLRTTDAPPPTHAYRESPAFAGIERFSFAYIFEVPIERPNGADARAFRLEAIHAALDPDDPVARSARSPKDQAEARRVFEALIEPLESFHDDVTTGPPGTSGRPLVFAAQESEDVSAARAVHLVRPQSWRFVAEGRRVEMHAGAAEPERTVALEFRDTFCAFESGRLFYVLSLIPAAGATIDEYAALQLIKLGHPTFTTEALREAMRFRWKDGEHSLLGLLNARLAELASPSGPAPGGVRDVIDKWILERRRSGPFAAGKEKLGAVAWEQLRGVVIGIEDEKVFQTVQETRLAKDVLADNAFDVLQAGPPNAGARPPPPHIGPDVPDPVHRALAVTALLQGVPDFPYQGGAEIWDSTREIHGDQESFAIFSHPGFVIGISSDWRELRDGRDCLGHCPYLLLTWLVAAHDEAIVKDMEKQLSDLLYGWQGTPARGAVPLKGLRKTLRIISRQLLPGPSPALRRSLELRFELFRRLTVNRSSGYLFRYPAESRTLTAMSQARGISDRFQRALDLLDRYENIVEDVQELGRMESDRRLNVVLGLVALIGVISVFAEWNSTGWWPFRSGDPTAAFFAIVGGVVSLGIAWLLIERLRR